MAVIIVAYHPELTPERAMEVFRSHFADRYDVHKIAWFERMGQMWGGHRDFIVKKSAWTGVGVNLEQRSDTTRFVFVPMMPTPILVVVPLLFWLVLRASWKALEEEVRSFIEGAPEFN